MENANLAKLESALERERQTAKRQQLLRQIWKVWRGTKHESSAGNKPDASRGGQQEQEATRAKSSAPAQGKSNLHSESASTAV